MRGRLRRGAGDGSLAARDILTARASGRLFWEMVSYGEIEIERGEGRRHGSAAARGSSGRNPAGRGETGAS